METDELVKIILFLVILGAMTGFIIQYGAWWTKEGPVAQCKLSVNQAHALKAGGDIRFFSTNLQCPARDMLITDALDNKFGQINAKQQIAGSMYDCFDKFWKGDIALFENEGVFCSVCDWIEFADKGKKFGRINEYMAETLVPGSSITYMDFLAKKETPLFREMFENAEYYDKTQPFLDEEIDSNNLYSTVFVYIRGTNAIGEFQEKYLMNGGNVIAGTMVGSTGGSMSLGGGHIMGTKALELVGGNAAVARFGSGVAAEAATKAIAAEAAKQTARNAIVAAAEGSLAEAAALESAAAGEVLLASEAGTTAASTTARRFGLRALIGVVMRHPTAMVLAGTGGVTLGAALSVIQITSPEWVAMPILVPHNEEAFNALGCQAFVTTKEKS